MSARRPIPLPTQTYEARSKFAVNELLQNMYAETNPAGAKGPVSIHGTPGLKLRATLGSGPIRGAIKMGEKIYAVSGNEAYSLSRLGASTLIGEVKGSGPVQMATNGTHVVVATNQHFYALNDSEILDLPDEYIRDVTYQDGYVIAVQGQSEQFIISALDDATSWNALDFSSADTFPDNLVGVESSRRELWLFGEETIEVWQNTGAALFPFQRAGAGFIERGCRSAGSIAKIDNRLFWLGDDLQVYAAAGYEPRPISTPAVVKQLEASGSPETARGFAYRHEGHVFYELTIPETTLVYDLVTQRWHTRKSDGISRWRVSAHVAIWDGHVVGDYENGNLYDLDLDTYDENGSTLQRRIRFPVIHNNGYRGIMDELYLDIEGGTGIITGQGSDPQAVLRFSDDGGETWSNELWAPMGTIGQRYRQLRWHRLGAFRQRILEVTVSDPVKFSIQNAYANVEMLTK